MALFKLNRLEEAANEKKLEGNLYFAAKQYREAIEAFSAGLAMVPTHSVLLSNRSACYGNLQQWRPALEDARKAVAACPSFAKGYRRATTACYALGLYADAASLLSTGLAAVAPEEQADLSSLQAEGKAQQETGVRALEELLGPSLASCPALNTVSTRSVLQGASKIGLYFSAHWCPPCKQFTPKLVDVYNALKAQRAGFELVFVSADHSAEEMKAYIHEAKMPWHVLPFGAAQIQQLNQRFQVRGIPFLAIVSANGSTISTQGVQQVYQHRADAFKLW
jgi:tetratricopeptide (TPR) repeat protein